MRHWPPFAVVLAAVCCTLPLNPAIAQGVAEDTPGTTPAGISYTIPKDWSSQVSDSAVAITAPEGDAKVVIVESRIGEERRRRSCCRVEGVRAIDASQGGNRADIART